MKKLLLLSALLLATPAQAATITVFTTNSFGGDILAQSEILGYSANFLGNTSGGVVSAISSGNTFELAANNVHNTIPDTLNIYALWQGLTSPSGLINVTTQMATDEYAYAGWTISELVYINGGGIVGHTQVGLYGAPTQTFTVPTNAPYDLQLQLQFVSNGAPPYGDFGAYVIATLSDPPPVHVPSDPPPVHVPGPIVGAGLPGLFTAFGIWWLNRRRQKAA
jgi:hypothetical protein